MTCPRDKTSIVTSSGIVDQAFAHCLLFPIVASLRSLGRVSILVWLILRKY